MPEKYCGYDLDDIPGDVPRISDAEVDALIDERQQRKVDDICDPEKINAAIESIRDVWEAA